MDKSVAPLRYDRIVCLAVFCILISSCVPGSYSSTDVDFVAHGMSVIKSARGPIPTLHEMTILSGDELELTCLSRGLVEPSIHWYNGDIEMKAEEDDKGQKTLKLTGVTGMANYTCVASSSLGELRAHAHIKTTECQQDFHADLALATVPGCSYPDVHTTLTFFDNITSTIEQQFAKTHIKVSLVPISCPDFPPLNERVFTDKLSILDEIDAFENTKIHLKDTLKYLYSESFSLSRIRKLEPDVRRVVIIVVDNTEDHLEDAIWESSIAKFLHGVELFIVGVGKHVSMENLERLASDPVKHHAFHVEHYRQLHWVVRKIVHGLCL